MTNTIKPSPPSYAAAARSGWIILFITCGISIIPVFGFSSWLIGGPLLLAAFIVSVVVLSQGGTLQGILLLLCSGVVAPIFIFFAPILMTLLGVGAVTNVSTELEPNVKDTNATSGSLPRVPLFREPQKAAYVPLQLGLESTAPDKLLWRSNFPDDWFALSKLITHQGGFAKVGDMDNEITCMHTSVNENYVEKVFWRAKVFNEAGIASTVPRFKQLCLEYCKHLGVAVPAELFQNVNPSKGQRFETPECEIELRKESFKIGHGWTLVITSK
jgi:hypothetical protein